MVRGGSVYILTNYDNDVLYIGVTSDLFSRIVEHKEKYYPSSFTAKYNCYKLVYYENFMLIEEAIAKEKQLKNWKRQWKINLINNFNPDWEDLFYKLEEET
ncbi:GIY-YIG nuclease family protein [Pedobacter nanyangensis]|uniref:GIY-YIG nuclease family protein n=1 Tax=Pedobacter nanyangensis TaxID=1562389 RepID=UPI000DE2505D|nr:GIY-YIG nuclease family protein [Pedobacter nanyangensis]